MASFLLQVQPRLTVRKVHVFLITYMIVITIACVEIILIPSFFSFLTARSNTAGAFEIDILIQLD